MDEKTADKILSAFFYNKKNKDFQIHFWGGEPFLNYKIIKYVINKCNSIIKNIGGSCRYLVATNGTILSDEMISFLLKEKVSIQISLDGDAQLHNNNRRFRNGKLSHHIVMRNIERLKELDLGLSIKSTFYRNSVLDSVKYLDQLGIVYSITPAYEYVNEYTISPSEIIDQTNSLMNYYTYNIDHGFCKKNIYNSTINHILMRILLNLKYTNTCDAGIKAIEIGVDSSIIPCSGAPQDKVKYGSIDEGINKQSLINFHEQQKKIVSESNCRECWLLSMCGSSCYYMTYFKKAIDPIHCAWHKTIFERLFKYIAHLKFQDNGMQKIEAMCKEIKLGRMGDFDSKFFQTYGDYNHKFTTTVSKTSLYRKKNSVKLIDLGEEGVIVNQNNVSIDKYIVNNTSCCIWGLIDGYRTAQEIAQEIAAVCEVPIEQIKEDIYQQLVTFKELGFIEEVKEIA